MPTTTYEITFYDLRGAEDSRSQHTTAGEAWDAFRLFAEPDSAEIYSRITLTAFDWNTGTEKTLATLTF